MNHRRRRAARHQTWVYRQGWRRCTACGGTGKATHHGTASCPACNGRCGRWVQPEPERHGIVKVNGVTA